MSFKPFQEVDCFAFVSRWFSLFVILQILTQAFINLQAGWQLSLALPNAPLSFGCVNLLTK